MSGWRGALGRLLDALFGLLSRLLLSARRRLGRAPKVQIVAFDGYLSGETGVVRGRVVEDRGEADGGGPIRGTLAKVERNEIPHAVVRASLGGCSWEATTDEQGYFRLDLPLGAERAARGWVRVEIALVDTPVPVRGTRQACELLRIAETATIGVLSDIDDTVVRSSSGDKLEMAARVLLQHSGEREPVAGVPRLYRRLEAGGSGSDDNPIFYHSSASWNTYEHVHRFLQENGIPRGPMFLRQYNAESLLSTTDTDHKVAAIDEVLRACPSLPFLLIGDGAGDDAEAYLETVRAHGRRIAAVYLRRPDDPEREARVREIAREIGELEGEVLVVDGSAEIERHAVRRGWIGNGAGEEPAA